jgi:dTDP-4-amino-4,6-dideoxygalactose transaminase
MYKTWPIKKNQKLRPELLALQNAGYSWNNPDEIIAMFEEKVATFAGSKYAVAVDSCSHGIFLSLKYFKKTRTVTIPSHTYISVPMQIIHAGCNVQFEDVDWSGVYQLKPYPIFDGAVRWKKDMYSGGLHVLSFQMKKRIPIGKGGMILTDDEDTAKWLKAASHDGRTPGVCYNKDTFTTLGWHYNMTPEDAARGIVLMDKTQDITDDFADRSSYTDLSKLDIFK